MLMSCVGAAGASARDDHDNRTEEPAAVYNLVKSGEIRFTEGPTHFVKTI